MGTHAEHTKQALFEATLTLVADKGFAETTVDEIVELAGVAKGTVYYHFKSKAELVEELIVSRLAPLAERFREALGVSQDPDEQLRAIVCALIEFIRTDHQFAKVMVIEMWRDDRTWRDTVISLRKNATDILEKVIEDGVADGHFDADVSPALSASSLFGMVTVEGLSWAIDESQGPYDELVASLQRLVIRSLRA